MVLLFLQAWQYISCADLSKFINPLPLAGSAAVSFVELKNTDSIDCPGFTNETFVKTVTKNCYL